MIHLGNTHPAVWNTAKNVRLRFALGMFARLCMTAVEMVRWVSPTLTGDHENRVTDYTSVAVYDTTQITCPNNYSNPRPGDPCHPLAAQQHAPLAVYPEVTGALCANTHPGSYTGQDAFNDMLPVYQYERRYIVRRLTPLECCRLQGFPDWWEDGVTGSDSARYKMWGNGIALPCAVDVLCRITKEGIR